MYAIYLVRLKRFELLTHGLEGRCSIQLSYRRIGRLLRRIVERVMGIGPTRPAWKAGILPLNYTRISSQFISASTTLVYNSIIKKICQIFFADFFKKITKFFISFFMCQKSQKNVKNFRNQKLKEDFFIFLCY